jgi:hypothetical protein
MHLNHVLTLRGLTGVPVGLQPPSEIAALNSTLKTLYVYRIVPYNVRKSLTGQFLAADPLYRSGRSGQT